MLHTVGGVHPPMGAILGSFFLDMENSRKWKELSGSIWT